MHEMGSAVSRRSGAGQRITIVTRSSVDRYFGDHSTYLLVEKGLPLREYGLAYNPRLLGL